MGFLKVSKRDFCLLISEPGFLGSAVCAQLISFLEHTIKIHVNVIGIIGAKRHRTQEQDRNRSPIGQSTPFHNTRAIFNLPGALERADGTQTDRRLLVRLFLNLFASVFDVFTRSMSGAATSKTGHQSERCDCQEQ
jgi:hypothetical protein